MDEDNTTPTMTSDEFVADTAGAFKLADEHGLVIITDEEGKPRSVLGSFNEELPVLDD